MKSDSNSTKRIILWSHPRSRSTALERAFIEREDAFVIHEPFSLSMYLNGSADQIASGLMESFDEDVPDVLKAVCHVGANARHVFVKDFPYHCLPHLTDAFLESFTHSFLIRNPKDTVRSFEQVHPGFEDWEAGYKELLALLMRIAARSSSEICIVESDQLLVDTKRTLMKYCAYIDIEYLTGMTNWTERNEITAWSAWEKFHDVALRTRGFVDTTPYDRSLSDDRQKLVNRLEPIYREILSFGEGACK